MNLMFFALMQLMAPAGEIVGTRIEVDQGKNEFRVVVEEAGRTKIYPWELESPGSGLPPGNVGVLVTNKNGEVVGCGADNLPHRAAAVSSRSTPTSQIKPLRLKKNQSFATPWHDVAPLFVFFDECVKPGRRGGTLSTRFSCELKRILATLAQRQIGLISRGMRLRHGILS